MDELIERIFSLMRNMPNTDESAIKAWVLGQIAGSKIKNEVVWIIRGCAGLSVEMLTQILSELQVSHGEIAYCNGKFYVPLK